jgi:ribose transport system permease protein
MNLLETGRSLVKLATRQKAFLVIVGMLVLMLFSGTEFYSAYNLLDMLNTTSIPLILAFGVTLTVVAGACDLSIGGVVVVSGIVAIKMMDIMPLWAAILVALAVGVVVGFVNGFLVVQQKTEPFIITLGMGILLTGVAQQLTDAHPLPSTNQDYMMLGNGDLFGVPNLVLIMLVAFGVFYWLMRYTQYGRNLYALGGDYDVALYSGINVVRTKWVAFVVSGFTAALAGVLLSAKLTTGSSIFGDNFPLLVNCGVVVGGTSFAGGIGGIPQSALGMLVFGILENAMNMLGIPAFVQWLLKGVVIVSIIWMDCFYQKRKRELV